MFSIMHISDLHRSPIDPISNDELLSSLVLDRDHYRSEHYSITSPDIIVISGDLIQGAKLGDPDHEDIIEEQYEKAYEFLISLGDRFLDGDRSKLIITPGNHDIDWNIAHKSMNEIDPSEIDTPLYKALSMKVSPFRWDWDSRKLYQISDFEQYEKRFDRYRDLYRKIYSGIENHPIEIDDYCFLHRFDGDRIIIVSFNSCHGNDCFSYSGCIPESTIAKCHLYLRDNNLHNRLLIAVWHHNIEGPPLSSDYMDIETVRHLISKGFRLGLHGHQHSSQVAAHSIHLPQEQNIVVVASGSLCASHHELPVGTYRQYNIIEISDDYLGAKIHVREMATSSTFSASNSLPSESGSYLNMSWIPLKDKMGVTFDINKEVINKIVFQAEEKYNTGDLEATIDLLVPIVKEMPNLGRKLLFNSLFKKNKWKLLTDNLGDPQNVEELFLLIKSFARQGLVPSALAVLERFSDPLKLAEAQQEELQNWLSTIQEIKS